MFLGAHIILDDAEWHKSKNLNIPLGIESMILPAYSPELNPVERFWLYLKRNFLRNKLHLSIKVIKNKITVFFN